MLSLAFWRLISPEPMSGCWLWIGSLTPDGYGRKVFGSTDNGTRTETAAHRWTYQLFKGPIPTDFEIDHLCRVRCCVNPDHLEAVAQIVNWERSEAPSVFNVQKTACQHGHPFDEVNTFYFKQMNSKGNSGRIGRRCRICARLRRRREGPFAPKFEAA